MSTSSQRNKLLYNRDCNASVIAEADGSLRLDGPRHVLAPEIVERNEIMSSIAATAANGEEVLLPITRAMAAAWLKGIAAEEGSEDLHQLGQSSRTLSQTLLVRTPGTRQGPDNRIVLAACTNI